MTESARVGLKGSFDPQQHLAHLFQTYIHDPLEPKVDEVERLVYELISRQMELEEQNRELQEKQHHLEAYRDRYIDLYDFAPLGYATFDEEGFVQEINLAGAQLLGLERVSITGYSFSDYVAEKDKQTFLDHLRDCVKERREVTSELQLASKDNRSITVQLHSIPIEGLQDEILCKTAITDITQRRTMEEEIRRSREFLQTVIDAIPDTMLVINRDYRIVLANRAARELASGMDPTTCMSCHQFSHHRDLPCEGRNDPCPLRMVIKTKEPTSVTHTHFNAQGEEIYVEISAAPVFDESGEVIHIIESCRDITSRKKAEESLAEERNLLRTLIDNLPDYIYVKDTKGRFMAANLATAHIMGAASPENILGKTDYDFYPRELAEEYHADEEQLIRSGQPIINKDEPHLDRDGNPRTVLSTKVPLKDGRGKIIGLVGISRDITERKQAQQRIMELQLHEKELVKAELDKAREGLVRQARLAAVGQLSSTIAHELRTPLASIRNALYLLERQISKGEPEWREYMEMIRIELERANQIVTNCTEICRGSPPAKIQVDILQIINNTRAQIDSPNAIQWQFSFDHEPFIVYADSALMEQVFKNLFLNAIQALDGPGKITVEAKQAGEYDEIRVLNDGPAIPQELQDKLFDPLVTSKPSGIGLGLTICQQIVEQHGGRIELLSGNGQGAAFQISLPVQET